MDLPAAPLRTAVGVAEAIEVTSRADRQRHLFTVTMLLLHPLAALPAVQEIAQCFCPLLGEVLALEPKQAFRIGTVNLFKRGIVTMRVCCEWRLDKT